MDIAAAGEANAIPPNGRTGAPRGRRRRRWLTVFLATLALLVVAWLVLGAWNVNEIAITPGSGTPVASFIQVPESLDHPLDGNILFTDVLETQLTALTYLQERYFSSVAVVYSTSALNGPGTSEQEAIAQGFLDMSQAESSATAAALGTLGYTVSSHTVGALVYGIAPGSPASHALKVGQIITGVDGTTTNSQCAVVGALHGLKPGGRAMLSVEQSTISPSGAFEPGPTLQRGVTLGAPPKGLNEPGCGARDSTPTVYLGVSLESQLAWHFPVNVRVRIPDVGGPSAGLSMTLGIIDKLSGGHLTGNRIVAATGTIDPQGDVGDVGGVAQKTIAVERAGATVFFVPPQEYSAAMSKDTPKLHIYAVSTLEAALRILKRLGGTVPQGDVPAQAAP